MRQFPPMDYLYHLDAWWQNVSVPLGHVVMWSFQHLDMMNENDMDKDDLSVYVGDEFPSHPVWTGYHSVIPDPAVHYTRTLFVYFYRQYTTMFRLIFSFLKVRSLV